MLINIKNKDTLTIDEFTLKCCVGKNGFTKNKFEGDNKTPIGTYKLGSVYYRKDRVNQPITDYANDSRVNTTKDDPNNFFYVTKNVRLENPGTSIQVLLDAYLTENSDIRAFYALDQEKLEDSIFIPFPGTNNFLPNGSVTDPAKSNGSTDVRTPKTDDHNPNAPLSLYRELKFSIDNLPLFSSFRIKLIGTSTNQAQPPFIKNFRALGLA